MKTVFVGRRSAQWLLDGALHFAEKSIPRLDAVVCYTPEDVTKWASSLGRFVRALNEEYFMLMLDDYWVQECDAAMLDAAERQTLDGVAKIDLSGDRMRNKCRRWDDGFVVSRGRATYKASLQAAIWNKDYLLSFCKKGYTPWDFEIQGSIKAMGDGRLILGTSRPCLRYVNVLRRGKWYGQFDF